MTDIYSQFSTLLRYPGSGFAETARLLQEEFSVIDSAAAAELKPFVDFVAAHPLDDLEEHFTRTFEINPQCALEIGWHLFGEEYLRGQLLVRMREELRRYGIAESEELPDHITHVLAVLAAMPHGDATNFAACCVLPALNRMLQAFDSNENPYGHLLRVLQTVLCREFDLPPIGDDETDDVTMQPNADPLWSYPVQGLSGQAMGKVFVPLELSFGNSEPAAAGTVLGGERS